MLSRLNIKDNLAWFRSFEKRERNVITLRCIVFASRMNNYFSLSQFSLFSSTIVNDLALLLHITAPITFCQMETLFPPQIKQTILMMKQKERKQLLVMSNEILIAFAP